MVPASPASVKAHRVLIVDDYPDMAYTMAIRFQTLGCQAQFATTAEEAIRVGALFSPDLIMLDLTMPTVDGFEICRRMRLLDWGRKARIVAHTGWGPQQVRGRIKKAGFDDYLIKPVRSEELLALLGLCDDTLATVPRQPATGQELIAEHEGWPKDAKPLYKGGDRIYLPQAYRLAGLPPPAWKVETVLWSASRGFVYDLRGEYGATLTGVPESEVALYKVDP